ncbi:outer membrane beta-barrel domain-containing protein [Dasania sp. GY-MA-18]|uniref:Outer membrane beta-barrel domain-containing protein n=1 Tax=Dasania phycosphaerae TaxID=2950436 RepID=A0A9J6RLC4_9GAMM|nr:MULTISPECIES: outer membrane beta-barrel domain-containing protein [Dasania]MCR8922377.1 outer membrane beta-barrel domain-containing protein [Dasania sp. GY-MA-18]MCZ0864805.1 outer membrane beta-barrel domain-containing protein [Dasania phycosphaerae]MCZ0868533.1 outer membrane beta-barrel domain-containing protein [Dasania phycosphaerae]
MDIRHKRILLILTWLSFSSAAVAQDDNEQVIIPDIDRREIGVDAIDSENFAISVHAGVISIEDFETTDLELYRFAWHVSEYIFFEASYSKAQGDLTSYEELVGGTPLFVEDQREFTQTNIAIGFNILPGHIHFSDRFNFNSNFYLTLGAGNTEFLGDDWATITYGGGYQLLLTDFLAVHIDVRDHIFDRETFGREETTNNIELSMGLSYFF